MESFGVVFWNFFKIVMVFIVVYLIMFLFVVFDFINLFFCFVELVIVLFIVLVVLNNIFFKVCEGLLFVIFGFGFFYGFGFVLVMGYLLFCMVDILKMVIGFNIGVEFG